MLNYIWFALMAIALLFAVFAGTADEVTKGAIDSAKLAVDISIGLIGILALWLGIMRIAEKAGIVSLIARAIAPITRFLFPEVPRDHPAIGAIVMNLSANMLGLNNAATPLGIKAMEDLQKINPRKDTASNAMVMFMALSTTAIQLVPATVIGILAASGSVTPTAIIGSTLIATTFGTLVAVIVTRLVQPFFPYPDGPADDDGAEVSS